MQETANNLRAFYNSKTGRLVRRLLSTHIQDIWCDVKDGQYISGLGFAVPYMGAFDDKGCHVNVLLPKELGFMHWPRAQNNKVCSIKDTAIPLPTESMDKVLVIHHMEFAADLQGTLNEVWRVLKPRGRALFVVANRHGFWARTEWSPFGAGTPFSQSQLCKVLHENQFVTEHTEEGLFMPPIRKNYIQRFASVFETIGGTILPLASGVHIVEVSKQLYAPVNKDGTLSRIKQTKLRPAVKPVSAFKS